MEFDPGHAAISYPSRPCKLDRSFSWTGTGKSTCGDMLGGAPSQYSLTDLDYDYGLHDHQALDFFDMPFMFEDTLRQLASTPCFAYPPVPPQTSNSHSVDHTLSSQIETQHEVEPEINSLQLDIVINEVSSDDSLTPGAVQQDFSLFSWFAPTIGNTVSGSEPSMEPLNTTPGIPGLEYDEPDSFDHSSNNPTIFQARTNLEIVVEEKDSAAGTVGYRELNTMYLDSSTGLESTQDQSLPWHLPTYTSANRDHVHPQFDDANLWQSLLPSPNHEPFLLSTGTQDFPAEEQSLVLVKIDSKGLQGGRGPGTPPLPFNDLMSKFDSNPGSLLPKRKRRAFTEDGKTKVKKVRDSGACVFCKARKVSCTPKGACTACVRLASRTSLVDHICVRNRLRDTFVGVRALHGSSFDNRKARLEPLLSSLIGQPRRVQFSVESSDDFELFPFRTDDHNTRTLASLDIEVMECSFSSLCRWKKLSKVSGIYVTSDIFDGTRYVIAPSSLPSIDEFDIFGRKILLASDGGHSGGITLLLDQFLAAYCARKHSTDLRKIANLTSRIASLNNLVAYGFLNLRDGSYDLLEQLPPGNHHNERYISETVHDQIRLLAADGLEPAEKFVFSELDNINKHVSNNEHARMIIGICLLRLMLLYRDRLVRDDIRLRLPKQKKWHQYRLEKASFMYRRLTVAYGALCREWDTPLTMEWEVETGFEFSGDETLRNIYLQLQPCFRQFCDERLSLQYDDVLKVLLADPAKQQKTKKRRKTSR